MTLRYYEKGYLYIFPKIHFNLRIYLYHTIDNVSFRANQILKPALRTLYLELHTKTITNIATKIQTYFEILSNSLPFIEEIISKPDLSWDSKQSILGTLIIF
jgi:predicted nucleotide-binding protein (sugar kinase/HSP70/actin superfamily)